MRCLNLYLITLLLGLAVGLSAQANHFDISLAGGTTALLEDNRGDGLAGALSVNYHISLGEKTFVFVGAGLQYGSLRDATAGFIPCDFPLGIKVSTFSQLETYTTHSLQYTNQLGIGRRFGNFVLRGSLLPTYLLRDQIDYTEVISFDGNGRPDRVLEASIKPGERIAEGTTEFTVDYSSRFQLQGDIEANYQLSDRFSIGLSYRCGLTDYRLQNKTVSICGVVGCDEVDFERSRIDARSGSGFLGLRYKL